MEEFKNGVISEEALGEIAGGLKISKSAVKKILAGACVGVLALGAAGGAAGGGYLLYNKFKGKSNGPAPAGTASTETAPAGTASTETAPAGTASIGNSGNE